jgi:predicted sulfurtransferase
MKHKNSISIAVAAVLITIFLVWYGQRPITPRQATWDDVVAEAETGGYRLITTEALAEKYGKDPSALMLIDTRQEWEYRTGHIAGALLFPMEPTWWASWRKAAQLRQLLGPDKDRTVVFY